MKLLKGLWVPSGSWELHVSGSNKLSKQQVNQPTNQPISQSVGRQSVSQTQSVSQSVSRSVSQSVSQSVGQSASQSDSVSQSVSVYQSINQPISTKPFSWPGGRSVSRLFVHSVGQSFLLTSSGISTVLLWTRMNPCALQL